MIRYIKDDIAFEMYLEIGFLSKVYADGNLNSKWMDALDA